MSQAPAQVIRDFLETYIQDDEFNDDDDIFELGLVNSLMAMQLVLFLEKQFGLKLEGDDLDFNHFRSIQNIMSLLESKNVLGNSAQSAATDAS